MAPITIDNVTKGYPNGYKAVDAVSLDIADGEFMILVGPSGCGKSTLLRMIVGLEDITSGEMRIGGQRVNEKAPRDRNLSMVFQNYALYPHLTVFENIAFPLRLNKSTPDDEIRRRVKEAADLLELEELLERKPSMLSGGQRQRVAMGRAIIRQADAFLFDEPLSNLDAKLRGQMRTEISRMQRRLGTTTVYVTHDQTEAMTLGDRIAVMRKGILQQVGSPRDLYEQPANLFVAGFIGSPPMNFLPGNVTGDHLETPFGPVPLRPEVAERAANSGLVLAGIRPEHFEDAALVDEDKKSKGVTFDAQIDVTEWLGNQLYAYALYDAPPDIAHQLQDLSRELDSDQMHTQLVVALDPMSRIRDGEKSHLWFNSARMHLFDPRTGENLTRDPGAVRETRRTPPAEAARDEAAAREESAARDKSGARDESQSTTSGGATAP